MYDCLFSIPSNHIFCICSEKCPQFFRTSSHLQGKSCFAGIKVSSFSLSLYTPRRTSCCAGIKVLFRPECLLFPFLSLYSPRSSCHARMKVSLYLIFCSETLLHFTFLLSFLNLLHLICPRQRRKSGHEGVDMEGLQAGLEKLAMKPKVCSSVPFFQFSYPWFWGWALYILYFDNLCQGSPLKLDESEIKEVKEMADSQSSAMKR